MKKSNTLAVCAVICFLSAHAHADDRYWICGDDSWDNPLCWNTSSGGGGTSGLPLAYDNVYLTQSNDINRTVTYSDDLSPVYQDLIIDSTGTGTMTLTQNNGVIDFRNAIIGYDGTAILNISGGQFGHNALFNNLTVGLNSGSLGIVNLSGTGSIDSFGFF